MSLRTEYFVCAGSGKVHLMTVLLEPGVQSDTTIPNLAEARCAAREAANFLGVEVDDETRLRLVK